MSKPKFSQAADNNKDHILGELQKVLKSGHRVLEIASGTGQHAVHFSTAMPNVEWQASDRDLRHYGLAEKLANVQQPNLHLPIELNINHWPNFSEPFDVVYSANCIHIVDWPTVMNYVRGTALSLKADGIMILYGPFKYAGAFTTPSNAEFDSFLRETYPGGGIRDFEEVNKLAQAEGLTFEHDKAMPANNQLLIWRKS